MFYWWPRFWKISVIGLYCEPLLITCKPVLNSVKSIYTMFRHSIKYVMCIVPKAWTKNHCNKCSGWQYWFYVKYILEINSPRQRCNLVIHVKDFNKHNSQVFYWTVIGLLMCNSSVSNITGWCHIDDNYFINIQF